MFTKNLIVKFQIGNLLFAALACDSEHLHSIVLGDGGPVALHETHYFPKVEFVVGGVGWTAGGLSY